jgi:hypothetical protein
MDCLMVYISCWFTRGRACWTTGTGRAMKTDHASFPMQEMLVHWRKGVLDSRHGPSNNDCLKVPAKSIHVEREERTSAQTSAHSAPATWSFKVSSSEEEWQRYVPISFFCERWKRGQPFLMISCEITRWVESTYFRLLGTTVPVTLITCLIMVAEKLLCLQFSIVFSNCLTLKPPLNSLTPTPTTYNCLQTPFRNA